jgi:hypothetical protein
VLPPRNLFFLLLPFLAVASALAQSLPVWEGVYQGGGVDRFALGIPGPSGRPAGTVWVTAGQSFGPFTVVRFDGDKGALYLRDRAGTVSALRLSAAPTEASSAFSGPAPLSRPAALARLNRMIASVLAQRAGQKVHATLDFDLAQHVSANQLADLERRRAQVEQDKRRLFIAAWAEPGGHLAMFNLGDPRLTLLPGWITANLTAADLDSFYSKWLVASLELSASENESRAALAAR